MLNGWRLLAGLEAAISRTKDSGGVPFFVGATSGTTVLGAFDPLPEIADVRVFP